MSSGSVSSISSCSCLSDAKPSLPIKASRSMSPFPKSGVLPLSPINALKSTSPSPPGAEVSSINELKSTSPSGVDVSSFMNASRLISPSSKETSSVAGDSGSEAFSFTSSVVKVIGPLSSLIESMEKSSRESSSVDTEVSSVPCGSATGAVSSIKSSVLKESGADSMVKSSGTDSVVELSSENSSAIVSSAPGSSTEVSSITGSSITEVSAREWMSESARSCSISKSVAADCAMKEASTTGSSTGGTSFSSLAVVVFFTQTPYLSSSLLLSEKSLIYVP